MPAREAQSRSQARRQQPRLLAVSGQIQASNPFERATSRGVGLSCRDAGSGGFGCSVELRRFDEMLERLANRVRARARVEVESSAEPRDAFGVEVLVASEWEHQQRDTV
jgi:hypothetical protein